MAVDGGSGGGGGGGGRYLKSCFGRGEGGKKEGWGLGGWFSLRVWDQRKG